MYRRPKFLEILLSIREEMAREADYDPDLFAEMVRAGLQPAVLNIHELTEPKAEEGTNNGAAGRSKKAPGKSRRSYS
jgi:hypothetical protein